MAEKNLSVSAASRWEPVNMGVAQDTIVKLTTMTEQRTAGEITRLLAEWTAGRTEPASELWPVVYRELRQIASAYMRNERPDHSLQTTALVNEACLRISQGKPFRWENRKHFFCAMAQMMRYI